METHAGCSRRTAIDPQYVNSRRRRFVTTLSPAREYINVDVFVSREYINDDI